MREGGDVDFQAAHEIPKPRPPNLKAKTLTAPLLVYAEACRLIAVRS